METTVKRRIYTVAVDVPKLLQLAYIGVPFPGVFTDEQADEMIMQSDLLQKALEAAYPDEGQIRDFHVVSARTEVAA